jgi:hypothetical protein
MEWERDGKKVDIVMDSRQVNTGHGARDRG